MTEISLSDRERYQIEDALSMAPTVESICDDLSRIEAAIGEIERDVEPHGDDEMEWLLHCVNNAWRYLADTPSENSKDLGLKAFRLKVLADDAADDFNGYVADGMVRLLAASIADDVVRLGFVPAREAPRQ
jgi:hypothetical protein